MARKMKRYEVEFEGRKTKVSIPESEAATAALAAAIQDNLSPEAVVGIAACIGSENLIKDEHVQKQVIWFREFLINLVGVGEYNHTLEKIGL